jgi:hypothetical protein
MVGLVAVMPTSASAAPNQLTLSTFDQVNPSDSVTEESSISTGDKFDNVTATNGATLVYDEDSAHTTALNDDVRISTGASAGQSYVKWGQPTLDDRAELFSSVQLYFSAIPANSVRVINYANTGAVSGFIQVNGASSSFPGRLLVCDTASHCKRSTVAIATGQWVRVESRLKASLTAGEVEAKLYNNISATTPDATTTVNPAALNDVTGVPFGQTNTNGTTVNSVAFGLNNTLANVSSFWIDNVRTSVGDYPGQFVAAPAGTSEFIYHDFNDGTWGEFNIVKNAQVNCTNPILGACSGSFDASTAQSNAAMTQAYLHTDKRALRVKFKYQYNGTATPTTNQPIITVRNTNVTQAGGGGHFNIWLDAVTGTFRGDLQAPDNFDSGVAFAPNTVYDVEVYVEYRTNFTSLAKVRINGTEVTPTGGITSSTVDSGVPQQQAVAPLVRKFFIGSESVKTEYQTKYDNVDVRGKDSAFTPW